MDPPRLLDIPLNYRYTSRICDCFYCRVIDESRKLYAPAGPSVIQEIR